MLTSLSVVPPLGAFWPPLDVALYSSPTDLLSIRDVKGLEPVVAAINSREYGMIDGEFYLGTHIKKRNIVITFGLNNSDPYSVSKARDAIYYYFISRENAKIRLRFNFNDRPSVDIEGYVESIIGERFTRDPEMQVSIICPKPNFLSTLYKNVAGVSGDTDYLAEYKGSAAGGFVLQVYMGPNAYTGHVFIQVRPSAGSPAWRTMSMLNLALPAHSRLLVSTHQGAKRAEYSPYQGNPVNLFGYMTDFIYWISLYASLNRFRVVMPGTNIPRNWYLNYVDQYTGV